MAGIYIRVRLDGVQYRGTPGLRLGKSFVANVEETTSRTAGLPRLF